MHKWFEKEIVSYAAMTVMLILFILQSQCWFGINADRMLLYLTAVTVPMY
jgi:hypothetical protein